MFNKINISRILIGHWSTLRNANSAKTSASDVTTMYAIPTATSVVLVSSGFLLTPTSVSSISTAFAVLAALLFNLLLLTFDLARRKGPHAPREQIRQEILRQSYQNISYCILAALVVVALLMFYSIVDPEEIQESFVIGQYWMPLQAIYKTAVSAICYFLIGNFLLTLLMVLKRVYVLFGEET